MEVTPFAAQGQSTTVHNALLDAVMPKLGPNAWKVLCAILRETMGWSREQSQLNHAALLRLTGISSKATLVAAIDELLAFKCGDKACPLIVVQRGAKWEAHSYQVNRKVRIKWNPATTGNKAAIGTALSGTETVPPSTETVPGRLVQKSYQGSGTETVPSYRKETNKEKSPSAVAAPKEPTPAKATPINETGKVISALKQATGVLESDLRGGQKLRDAAIALIGEGVTADEIALFTAKRGVIEANFFLQSFGAWRQSRANEKPKQQAPATCGKCKAGWVAVDPTDDRKGMKRCVCNPNRTRNQATAQHGV